MQQYEQEKVFEQVGQRSEQNVMVNSFIRSVYNWMAVGLALTGGIALFASQNAFLKNLIFGNRFMFYGLIIGELAMVFFLSARISKIKASTATALFLGYAALNGLTLSFIFLVYTSSSIASTFFICAGMFAGLSIYGMVTKRDLTSIGNFMIMGLFGIILASVVNIFMQSHFIHMLVAYAGVLIFTGLTAYDTQKIKEMAISQPAGLGEGVVRKGAIMGALTLYLDFINLFLMLLRIFGDSD